MAEVNFGETNPWVRTQFVNQLKTNRGKLGYIYLAEGMGLTLYGRATLAPPCATNCKIGRL